MTLAPPCPTAPDDGRLIEYWLGELPATEEAALEEHLLGCAACAAHLDAVVALAGGVRDAFRQGRVSSVLSDGFVRRLTAQGLRVREYRVPRNGSVLCTVAPDDDLVIGRLQAPLQDVRRLDLVSHTPGHPAEQRTDIPFDRARDEVVLAPSLARLRSMPSHVQRIELFAVDDLGRQLIGEYTFNHRAAGD